MNAFVLGLAMLVQVGGMPPATDTVGAAVAPAAFTVDLSDVAPTGGAAPALSVPRDLLAQDARFTWRRESSRAAQPSAAGRSSTAVRVLGVAVGAVGGFMAGGAIGYRVTQRRDVYDDGVSGLKGAVIGAPIGAAVGAIIGYRLTK